MNNAAITGETPASDPLSQRLAAAFRTNATGPAVVVEAFAPLLRKSTHTVRIVNVTSGAGSIALRLDPTNPYYDLKSVAYRASKAALNMSISPLSSFVPSFHLPTRLTSTLV